MLKLWKIEHGVKVRSPECTLYECVLVNEWASSENNKKLKMNKKNKMRFTTEDIG